MERNKFDGENELHSVSENSYVNKAYIFRSFIKKCGFIHLVLYKLNREYRKSNSKYKI